MSTHFPNKIPNCLLKEWFIIDCYFTQIDDLKVGRLNEIWDAGFRNLYISMGYKYRNELCNYIETLVESTFIDIPTFNVVLFDSLNMAHENIKQLVKYDLYIIPNYKKQNTDNKMFKSVKHIFNDDEKYFIDNYRNFMSSNDYSLVRYYYHNQLHIKSIINDIKGPFKSNFDYGVKLLEYLNEMKPKKGQSRSSSSSSSSSKEKKPLSLNYYEMKEIINYCANNNYINWSQSIN